MRTQIPDEFKAMLKDKANLPKSEMRVITPQIATAWLNITKASGFQNRAVKPKLLEKLCQDLTNNQWILNGEAIIRDKEGVVIDGQHRLLACIRTGKSFPSMVTSNVERKAFSTIDCGCARTPAQVLRMEGVKYPKTVAAIINTIDQIRTKTVLSKSNVMTNSDSLEFQTENAEILDKVIMTVYPLANKNRHMTPRMAGAALYVLVTDYGYSWDDATDFILGCLSSETHPNTIVNKFRNELYKRAHTKTSEGIKFCNLVLVWNAIQTGRRCCPAFRTDFDEIPEFVHA